MNFYKHSYYLDCFQNLTAANILRAYVLEDDSDAAIEYLWQEKQSHGKNCVQRLTKACKCTSLVSAGGMFAIKLSSVSEQTQSGSMAPSNAQLSQWFLVQICLDPTENVIYAQKHKRW